MQFAAGYRFTNHALDDLLSLVETYNERRTNLGEELADQVLSRVEEAILPAPEAFGRHHREPDLRICRLGRFPVKIIYLLHDGLVVVFAVEHMREFPDKWRTRLLKHGED